jgi:ferredoxin
MSTYSIEIDRSLCSGFGSCLKESPTVFALDGDGIATLLVAETADEGVLAAAGSCPMGAIAVFDLETGEEAA